MAKLYIRWMGAFRRGKCDLRTTLEFEINRRDTAACEEVMAFNGRYIPCIPYNHSQVHIGCMVDNRKIYRRFKHDCHSYYVGNTGLLKNGVDGKTKGPRTAQDRHHTEAWLDAKGGCYVKGFVVYGNLECLSGKLRGPVRLLSARYNIPVYELSEKGKLVCRGVLTEKGSLPSKKGGGGQ